MYIPWDILILYFPLLSSWINQNSYFFHYFLEILYRSKYYGKLSPWLATYAFQINRTYCLIRIFLFDYCLLQQKFLIFSLVVKEKLIFFVFNFQLDAEIFVQQVTGMQTQTRLSKGVIIACFVWKSKYFRKGSTQRLIQSLFVTFSPLCVTFLYLFVCRTQTKDWFTLEH